MKNLFNKSHKTLKKVIKEVTRRLKETPCSWMDRNNIVRRPYYQ
jgi:hypothetical protein